MYLLVGNAAVHLVVQEVVQWNTRKQTQKEVVPVDYLLDRYTLVGIAAVHLVVQKVVQWKFRRQTQKEVVPVDYLYDRVGR